MKGYLLDTDIVVFLFRGKKGIVSHLSSMEPNQIYVSEVTVAELEYGNHLSGRYEENKEMLDRFLSSVHVLPFSVAILLYAKERYRLKSIGLGIEDFDLLIGCTSVVQGLTMVTNNLRHYSRIEGIQIENWVR